MAYVIIGIIWAYFAVKCGDILARLVLYKIYKVPKYVEELHKHFYYEKIKKAKDFRNCLAFLMISAYVIFTPIYFEFPVIFGKGNVATFNQAGEPIYHKWGLFTPQNSGVVNIPQGWQGAYYKGKQKSISDIFVKENNLYYQITIFEKWKMVNPTKFYSKPERRMQKITKYKDRPEGIVKNQTLSFFLNNKNEIEKIAKEKGLIDIAAVNSYIESTINQKLLKDGLVVKISSQIHKFQEE